MTNINRLWPLFILINVFCSVNSVAQVNRTKMVGAYVYNFSRYTFWPDEAKLDSFRILLITTNSELITEFNQFSKSQKTKNKPISLRVQSTVPNYFHKSLNMIFLDQEKSALFAELNKRIEDKPILLVTDNFIGKQLVMINIYDSPKQELQFEVNKANVINHNLRIDPEILLIGGTEIDVASLYRTSQKEMELLQQKMVAMNDSLTRLKDDISQTLLRIKIQQAELLKQETLLRTQNDEIELGKLEIVKQKTYINNQLIETERQNQQIFKQTEELNDQINKLEEQQRFIDRQKSEIEKSRSTLDSLASEIENKNSVLNQQTTTIDRQKQILLLAVITVLLAFIALFSIINGYRNKAKKNKLLVSQKTEIEKMNKKLVTTNKSLFQTIGQLKETQSQLVSSEKMASLGVLTAGIAHEINNPVNFIYTGVNSLKKDYEELDQLFTIIDQLTEKSNNDALINQLISTKKEIDFEEIIDIIPQTITDIQIGAERAADIIRGLRNFSRIDKDSKQLSDIHEGIDTALLLLRNKFKNHIKIDKHYSQLPKVECFPGKLNQAFLNIFSNAIDAIEKDGIITISTSSNDNQIQINIEDNGKGISEENINKIFDPFFTTKSVGKGVGLGLSITFGIIQEHHGKIEVKSTENVGTIFTISLPCVL